MKEELVILVDQQDNIKGTMEKMLAHKKGLLHRAFSVFVFNDEGDMLLQRRALTKYHSPGLWTNACCSHPRPTETVHEAATRRLHEEMGFSCITEELFSFVYRSEFENGLTEHEFDHVLIGQYNLAPIINRDEVEEWKWLSLPEVSFELAKYPETFTVWFRIAFEQVKRHIRKQQHSKQNKPA